MRNVTTMIKSKAFNQIRKVLRPEGRKGKPSTLSVQEQFDLITKIINTSSQELRNYKSGKKERRKIEKARIERGYKPKKKTTKEQWEEIKKQLENNKVA